MKRIDVVQAVEETIGHRHRQHGVIGEPAARNEELELSGLRSAVLVHRTDDVAGYRPQHVASPLGGCASEQRAVNRSSARSYGMGFLPSLVT